MNDSSKIFKGSRQDDFFSTCEGCKSVCCKGARPPLTLKRISIIRDYLLAEKIDIKRPFVRKGYSFPRENSHGYCIFFDTKTKMCKIHFFKPETCVAGPITFDIDVVSGVIEWYLKSKKICMLVGALYRDEDKLREHLRSAKMEINTLVRELPKKELLAILNIDEPETFKIAEDRLDSDFSKAYCAP